MKQRSIYRDGYAILILLLALSTLFAGYTWSQRQVNIANENRLQSILLTNELRQSSDDLTRMVRTYIATSDSAYKVYFQHILDIRDGKKARPQNYQGIYWDFISAGKIPAQQGAIVAVALTDLMRSAGFTEEEFSYLKAAKKFSDELTKREFEAMSLIEQDGSDLEQRRLKALRLLHDAVYHQSKAEIMAAINATYISVDNRTKLIVQNAENRAQWISIILSVLGALLIIAAWRTYRDLRVTLGGSVSDVGRQISQISQGDFSLMIDFGSIDSPSIYGQLSRAQFNLYLMDKDRNAAEEHLKLLNLELDKRVEERTEALQKSKNELAATLDNLQRTQNQLVQSEKLASLGGLVAGVAHEINTPVGITVTSASTLRNATTELLQNFAQGAMRKSEIQSYLQTADEATQLIIRNAERAANLVQSFKLVAADQTSETRRRYQLKAYIEEVVASLQPRLKQSGSTVSIQCPTSIELDGYPGALAQIITNLTINSLTHAFADGARGLMNISVEQINDKVILQFQDNGKGILLEHIDKVFDPFFTTRRGTGGTGLGLNITHNIVQKQFGGEISVVSKVGEGTCFTMRFPRVSPISI